MMDPATAAARAYAISSGIDWEEAAFVWKEDRVLQMQGLLDAARRLRLDATLSMQECLALMDALSVSWESWEDSTREQGLVNVRAALAAAHLASALARPRHADISLTQTLTRPR